MNLTKDTVSEFIAEFRVRQSLYYSSVENWPDKVVARSLYKERPKIGSRWGVMDLEDPMNLASEGLFLRAAHWLFVTYKFSATDISPNLSPQAMMNVASKSIGDANVAFRIAQMQKTTDDSLSLTKFGVEFLDLREDYIGGFVAGTQNVVGTYP